MATKERTCLNLPDSVRQLYHRRYSDSDYRKMKFQGLPAPGQRRRFSFSTYEDTIRDITPVAVRERLNKVLKNSGFTAYKQAESQQYRRYSTNIDPNMVNLLRPITRPGSFKERIDKSEVTKSHGMERQDFVLNKNTNQNVVKEVTKNTLISAKVDDNVKKLWGDKCRDSLKKLRNQFGKKTNPNLYPCVSYKRQLNATDSDLERLPKCKYKLRENGLIAAELASFSRHINVEKEVQEMSEVDQVNEAYQRCPQVETSHKVINAPNITTDNTGNDQMQMARPQSSSNIRKFNKELKTKSTRPDSRTSPKILEDNYQYSFYQPEVFPDDTADLQHSRFQSELLDSWKNLSPSEKRRWSTSSDSRKWSLASSNQRRDSKSDFSFEIIGSASLHGAPEYRGRLKILTSRTVHFDNV